MADEKSDAAPISALVAAMTDSGVLRLYANGFTLGLTNADTSIVLQLHGRPIAILNVSYTLAKTLSLKLERLVAEWETKTGNKLVTTDDIDKVFGDSAGEKKE